VRLRRPNNSGAQTTSLVYAEVGPFSKVGLLSSPPGLQALARSILANGAFIEAHIE
jgi:hypothetical protein